MREAPAHVTDAEVLAAVRETWAPVATEVEHLPVGFGAHHWRASADGRPLLFVTLDRLGPRHTFTSLAAAYDGAAALAGSGLEFVAPTLSVVRFGDGALSATAWIDGVVAGEGPIEDRSLAEQSAAQLARLHAAEPPPDVPRWAPLVPEGFASTLTARLRAPWDSGPYAARARDVLLAHEEAIARWTAAYHQLAAAARERPWVCTHGEPHSRNLLLTADGPVLVDWESLKLAPRERDLRTLVDSGHPDLVHPCWPMIELFDLEWRLDEIGQYAQWFAAPHTGTASDTVAFEGLVEELQRPEWSRP